ncbi:MAG: GntR family transcriptional regulator [Ktedonobacteraceae bacterium]|nr:GntR family transcriptional regulator [Ktedonobacteraceae bacterium]
MDSEMLPAKSSRQDTPPLPKYYQIKEIILRRINEGIWSPGAAIPSEPELCAEFGVSRITIRRAISDLTYDGKVYTIQGKGTFVARPKVEESFVQSAFGIYEDFRRRGLTLTTTVLQQKVIPVPEVAQDRLKLHPHDRVHMIMRLRSVLEEKLLVSTTYIPFDLCPGLEHDDLSQSSLYELLESRYGLHVGRGERLVEATAARPGDALVLAIAVGSPLLLLDTLAYLPDGRPLEWSTILHRGDRMRMRLTFVPASEEAAVSADGRPSNAGEIMPYT